VTPQDVYVQTEKGRELLKARRDALPSALRIAFFIIDGKSTAEELLSQLSGLGVTAESFDVLLAAGCIAPKPSEPAAAPSPAQAPGRRAEPAPAPAPAPEGDRFFLARQFMNETIVNSSGLRSFFFTLKLEKANSIQELRDLLPEYVKQIEKATGRTEAELLARRARDLMSEGASTRRGDPRG